MKHQIEFLAVLTLKNDIKMLFLIIYVSFYTCLPHIGPVARFVEKRSAFKMLVGKPEGKRPLGRPGIKWGDNIKIGL